MNIILSVVACGWQTWSLTIREKHRLRVFENRVLRRMFGPKREEVTRDWRKLYNEELNDMHSPKIVQVTKLRKSGWEGHLARMGEVRHIQVLVGKPEGKGPIGRPRRRW